MPLESPRPRGSDAEVDEAPDDHEAAHEDAEAHQCVAEHLNPLFRSRRAVSDIRRAAVQ